MNVHTNNRQDAELLALREKYSTVCYICGGSGQCCTNSNCTNGRVMMLDAEGVKALADKQVDKWIRDTLLRVLKGGSQ